MNFKSLRKEIKKDLKRLKKLQCSWICRINIVKMTILGKAIYRFNAILIKIPTLFNSSDFKRAILKLIWNTKKSRRGKTILDNKKTSGGVSILDLKQYKRAIVLKNCMVFVR